MADRTTTLLGFGMIAGSIIVGSFQLGDDDVWRPVDVLTTEGARPDQATQDEIAAAAIEAGAPAEVTCYYHAERDEMRCKGGTADFAVPREAVESAAKGEDTGATIDDVRLEIADGEVYVYATKVAEAK